MFGRELDQQAALFDQPTACLRHTARSYHREVSVLFGTEANFHFICTCVVLAVDAAYMLQGLRATQRQG